jgi:hypothetical protein
LQYPDDISAQYPYAAGGTGVTATATWDGSASLSLSVSCAGEQRALSGTSPLTVSVAGGSGRCTVTLSETQSSSAAVPYSLTIGPP